MNQRALVAVVDEDGENRPLRYFLMVYGGNTTHNIKSIRDHLTGCGYHGFWPEWAEKEDGHLTKAGAQLWIKYLISLESNKVQGLFELMDPEQSQFWESCYPEGVTLQDIANELSDMAGMIDSYTKVVHEVTGGQLSKPNYPASLVISEYQQNLNRITFEYANEHANDMLEAAAGLCEYEGASHDMVDMAIQIRALKTSE